MKPVSQTGLGQNFRVEVFVRAREALRAASADSDPVRSVFQALETALEMPGVAKLDKTEIPSGQISASGWMVPPLPEKAEGSWPVLPVEIPGSGAPYLKTETIRVNAFIVPLKLNTLNPRFDSAAMAVALLHAYSTFVKKSGKTPQRSLRFVFTACDESLEAFLEKRKPLGPDVFSALELDFLSRPTGKSPTLMSVDSAQFGQRSFVTEALLEFFNREKSLSLKEKSGAMASLALQPFRIPFALLQGSITDTNIKAAGRALLRTMKLLGDTDYEDGLKFIRPQIRRAAAAMRASPAQAKKIYNELQGRLRGFEMLLHRGPWWVNPKSTIVKHRKAGYLINDLYYPRWAYSVWLSGEDRKLKALLPPRKPSKLSAPSTSPALCKAAKDFVPARNFNGVLKLEADVLPVWMQVAANYAVGKKTVLEISSQLTADGFKVDLKQVFDFFVLLEKCGKVQRKPIITSQQIIEALRSVGIEKGDTVMIHVGYAAYGFIEAGPQGLIDLFQDAVGSTGTVCMPAHTVSLVGNPPFDHDRTPAQTGLVPTLFSKAPDTIRGWHPTHSVAARGPLAEHLLERADAREPVFGPEGFWGRFHDADGKILMFCNSLGPNTFLHGVDYLAGAALPDSLAHLIRNGRREEVTIKGVPFHTDSFQYIYKAAEKENVIHEAPLGTGKVYAMRAQDMQRIGIPVVRANPLLATAPNCDCDYCEHLRRAEARRKNKD